jgi:molybdopterin converting factor small subunit
VATLRLFAALRELAGISRVEIEGGTVADVLESASTRYGADFRRALATAAVWRNGEAAQPGDPVSRDDELALIPPVSGGSEAMARMAVDPSALTGAIAVLLLIAANLAEGPAWWAAALVAVGAFWAVDLARLLEARGKVLAVNGLLLTLVLSAVSTHTLGGVGLGLVLFVTVAVMLGWGVAINEYRQLDAVAPAAVVGLLGGAAVGSLMLTRTVFEPEFHSISVFLLVVVVATVAAWVLERLAAPLLDPFAGTALAALVAAAVGALLWDEDFVGYLLVGLGLAVTLVAGRSFGALMRTGRLALSQSAPGAMTALDGALFAAAFYYPLVTLAL